jgi:5-(carboxyamino)imidazole ribonucleotide synthase
VIEELVPIDKELSVIVSRNESGDISVFPTVELTYNEEANLVEFLLSPARINQELDQQASTLAVNLIEKLGMVGLLAVEMFLTQNGELLVNEIAPRPHNSGHHSIEGNYTSQYLQHLRSILNLKPGDTSLRCPAVMLNLLANQDTQAGSIIRG